MTNPYTIVNACDSEGNYILFNTGSSQKTRDWSRASTSGRIYNCVSLDDTCIPNKVINAKRKLTILKYSNDNNQGPGQPKNSINRTMIGNFSSGTTNRNLSRGSSSSVQIGNVIYPVPTNILNIIHKMQAAGTLPKTLTHATLKTYIKEIRKLLDSPSTNADLLLKDIPLSQYKPRYVYKAGSNKWPTNSDKKSVYLNPKNFPVPFKLGNLVVDPLASVYTALSGLIDDMFTGTIQPEQAQYLTVVRNNTCEYTGTLADMWPATTAAEALTSASVWGSTIVAQGTLNGSSEQAGGIFNVVIMTPANSRRYAGKYRSRIGVILGLTGQRIVENKTDLASLISNTCGDCIIETVSIDPTCDPASGDFGIVCQNPGATDFVERVISCISVSSQANSELMFIPIMSDLDKLMSAPIPPGTEVTFPHALNQPLNSGDISHFNDVVTQFFTLETAENPWGQDVTNEIIKLSQKIATWRSGTAAVSIPTALKLRLCCKTTWECMNQYLCDCMVGAANYDALCVHCTDCPWGNTTCPV